MRALGCPGAKECGHHEQQTKLEVTLTPYKLARGILQGFSELPITPASQKSRAFPEAPKPTILSLITGFLTPHRPAFCPQPPAPVPQLSECPLPPIRQIRKVSIL